MGFGVVPETLEEFERQFGRERIVTAAAECNIRTANPKSLALLYDALSSLNNGVADSAWNALAKIGRPAVSWLVKGLGGESGSVQVYCSRALERIGPPAADALPALRKLLSSVNRDIAKAAEKAIAAIEAAK